MWIEILIFLVVIGIFFYRWGRHNHDFFKKRNIPHDKYVFFFGGSVDVLFRKKSLFDYQCDIYKRHEGIVYGTFENRDPILFLRDPELIKHVMIKDFDHFVNRRRFVDENDDNIFTNSLLLMENEKWRDMRCTLSPAFTGKKMRQMFELMLTSLDEAMAYLREHQQRVINKEQGFELDIKDFTTRLTTDIIASTAFGLHVNSFHDKENEFYVKAKKAVNFTLWSQIKIMFMILMPRIAKIFKIDMIDREYNNYFKRLVLDAMAYRKENNIHRPDMINLLMEARGMIPTDTPKTHHREWTDSEIVAQCFLFFFAALEPLSVCMSFAAHELMEYPEVQQKLFEEIQETNENLQGKSVTYEILQKMTYMDMVITEVLRKWPVTLATDRTCTKDFIYEGVNGEHVEIKKGDMVRAPMCALQRDPKYFGNPDVLDPERFSEDNKGNINSGTYLPFGLGPRNCIANRFALLEAKAFLYYLIRDYRLEASPKTCLPLELDTKNVQLRPKNGFWLQLIPRE